MNLKKQLLNFSQILNANIWGMNAEDKLEVDKEPEVEKGGFGVGRWEVPRGKDW